MGREGKGKGKGKVRETELLKNLRCWLGRVAVVLVQDLFVLTYTTRLTGCWRSAHNFRQATGVVV